MSTPSIACLALFASLVTVQENHCGRDYRFAAPDGRSAVVLRERSSFGDSSYELILTDRGVPDVRLAPVKTDCWLSFAHVAWSERSRTVAIYFGDALCGDTWVAFDRDRGRFLPFRDMADLMRVSLRDAYRLGPEDLQRYQGDPLQWAKAYRSSNPNGPDPSAEAFRKRLALP
jgi:hypothetical protein